MDKRTQKYRMTEQRRVILETVRKADSHPTAADIYNTVRRKIPRISLGTVYRNLEVLSEMGQINRIDIGDQRRYDANMTDHDHIRCISCGNIDDIPPLKLDPRKYASKRDTDYKVLGYSIDMFGLCTACFEKNNIGKSH